MHLNQVKANSNGNIKLMRIGNTAYNLDISWQNCVCVVIDRKYAGYAERGEATVLANLVPVLLLVVLLVVTPLIEATAICRRGLFQCVSLLIPVVRRETSELFVRAYQMYTLPVVHNLFGTSVLYVDDLFVRLSPGSLGS